MPYRSGVLPRAPKHPRSWNVSIVLLALLVIAASAAGLVRAQRSRSVTLDADEIVARSHAGWLASGEAVTVLVGDPAHARIIRVPGRPRRRGTNLVHDVDVIPAPGVVALMEGGRWAVTASGGVVEVLEQTLAPTVAQQVVGHGRVVQATAHGRARAEDGTRAQRAREGDAGRVWRPEEGAWGVVDLVDSDDGYCALHANGDVSCAFESTERDAGYQVLTSALRVPSPAQVVAAPHARGLICVRGRAGEVACAEEEQYASTPITDARYRRLPPLGLPRARRIAIGDFDLCVVGLDHSLWCVYGPDRAQPGAAAVGSGSLSAMHRVLDGVDDVALGAGVGCLRRTTGEVRCWGDMLADSGIAEREAPVEIPIGGRAERVVAVSSTLVCALVEGRILCWGRSNSNQVGALPLPRAIPSITRATGLAEVNDRLCASLSDGSVRCWRRDPFIEPADVMEQPAGVALRSLVNVGSDVLCATDAARHVWCARPDEGHAFHRAPLLDGSARIVVCGERICAPVGDDLRCAVGGGHGPWRNDDCPTDPDEAQRWQEARDLMRRRLVSRSPGPEMTVVDLTQPHSGSDETFERPLLDALHERTLRELRVTVNSGCAIGTTGGVACMTLAGYGDPPAETMLWPEVPAHVVPRIADAVELTAMRVMACARHGAGRVSCWGYNEGGALSHGESTPWVVGLDDLLSRARSSGP